jgi:hypothetical protein
MVLKLQNNIYKVKNKRKKNLTFELKDLKTNYVANQAEIFRKEKELSILIESELKAELVLIKGFARMNDEKITPHFLKMAKGLQKNPDLDEIEVPVEEKITGCAVLDRENYIKKFYTDLCSKPDGEKKITIDDIGNFLGDVANCNEVITAKLNDIKKTELDRELTIDELDAAMKKSKKNSTPGQDGINNNFIRSFWQCFRVPLFRTIQACLKGEPLPILSAPLKLNC